MRNVYRIGGKQIEITSIYDEVHTLCKDYLSNGNADFSVRALQSDIDFEREKSAIEDKKERIPTRSFPDSYLETLAVYRQIAEYLLIYDTILFHGSAVAVDGIGYLFTAKSGTGKSTHTRLWRAFFGDRAVMVNDDKPLIQIADNNVVVYGTPWDGKHHLSNRITVPLKAICILTRASENHIEQVTKRAAFPLLLQQTHRPRDPLKMQKTLEILDKIASSTPLYKLACNMEMEAAKIAYNEMKGSFL